MDRYDACFWRNSTMTSFAGSKSWNFCGRRGVNSSTALRTAAGSNEDIGLNAVDVNLETDRPRDSHSDAMAWTGLWLSRFTANAGWERGFGRGKSKIAACLRTIRGPCRCRLRTCRGYVIFGALD